MIKVYYSHSFVKYQSSSLDFSVQFDDKRNTLLNECIEFIFMRKS